MHKTIKKIEVGTLTVKLVSSYDLDDKFVVIKEELDNNSLVFFADELDKMIKTLQEFKKELDK